jgi:hypothetical protein
MRRYLALVCILSYAALGVYDLAALARARVRLRSYWLLSMQYYFCEET